jgi:hypothetical protein
MGSGHFMTDSNEQAEDGQAPAGWGRRVALEKTQARPNGTVLKAEKRSLGAVVPLYPALQGTTCAPRTPHPRWSQVWAPDFPNHSVYKTCFDMPHSYMQLGTIEANI